MVREFSEIERTVAACSRRALAILWKTLIELYRIPSVQNP